MQFRKDVLAELRTEADLSQSELARRSRTTASTISRAEAGEFVPSAEAVARIAKALGVPMDRFFTEETGAVA